MSHRISAAAAFVASALLACGASADMGRVTVGTEQVTVGESAQKAIILHNGKEEVLILGTELQAAKKTPIIRFIPFPSEPKVALASAGAFDALARLVAKYDLKFVHVMHSKGGGDSAKTEGVEVKYSARMGAHDMTVIEIHDVAAFRAWVNRYFKKKHLPQAKRYPVEEGIVADYVARGLRFFVLDFVEVGSESRFVDPVSFRFASDRLYYPLKTSNSFGGKGEIDLFIAAPVTMCAPGTAEFNEGYDRAAGADGNPYGTCLNLRRHPETEWHYDKPETWPRGNTEASSSALLVSGENDLAAFLPDSAAFFAGKPVFLQAVRYDGDYKFDNDVLVPLNGIAKAVRGPRQEDFDDADPFHVPDLLGRLPAACTAEPDPGVCKGIFPRWYFDKVGKSCKEFEWGGCGGNVPFETLEECKKSCEAK